MKFSLSARLAVAGGMSLLATGTRANPDPAPEPTPAPAGGAEVAAMLAARSLVTTSYYSFVTTEIPRDEYSVGMGLQQEGTDEYCAYIHFTPFLGHT